MQRNDNLIDLEKCCKMRPWLQKLASIQPRTSCSKFADTSTPQKVISTARRDALVERDLERVLVEEEREAFDAGETPRRVLGRPVPQGFLGCSFRAVCDSRPTRVIFQAANNLPYFKSNFVTGSSSTKKTVLVQLVV